MYHLGSQPETVSDTFDVRFLYDDLADKASNRVFAWEVRV